MSSVLKSASLDSVRPFLGVATQDAGVITAQPVIDPRDAEIDRLHACLTEAEAALASAEARGKLAIERASEEGRRAGRDTALRDDAARINALEKGMDAALAALDEKLTLIESLAPALARLALDKLVGDHDVRPGLVAAMIAHNLVTFRRDAGITITVSTQDFPALSADQSLVNGHSVRADPGLAQGKVRMEARLERLDLDLDTEWARIATMLDNMGSDA